jgi:hypothetical protein
MHRRWIILVLTLAACPGGEYVASERSAAVDTGDTNGRMFDFVSNKPEGDDWQIRVRGASMWVSYGNEDSTDELGAKNLSAKETRKVWKLIDQLDLPSRKKGKKDRDEGYVQLRLREPGGEDGHDIFQVYVSRDTEDDDVLALATYLRELVAKYHKEKPSF